ncbi:cytochrome c [Kordiimonas sp.]|uniref:cytochrome c n=1 Tax=Kordiimonas sp. TaxID=1970157 RepID=UPI003A8E7067
MLKKNELLPVVLFAALASAVGVGAVFADTSPAKPDPMQFARGAKAWAANCARCHNMKSAQDNSDEEWHVDVTHMRVRANIPGDVARDIKAFLQASNK